MRLKGLELQGFKSFADRTLLDFENGITAVVGPNGSGKSNIADAMRWVMGEQSAKSLRGGNMQDVIFTGTAKRKPLGFAEVSIIIDNTDKQLPVDFDEVIVTRRLFRSGESEYFINKSSVRLKDIHELFMDTGVGRDGYSVIGQGKISEIINTRSDDRRSIFEEAAGITKFRYRKEEAERKLAHTNDNVLRVNDIITEIEGQIGPLKQQSDKAKKYLVLRDKLKVLVVNVALDSIAKLRANIESVGSQTDILNTQLTQVNEKIEENERKTEEIFNSIANAEQFSEVYRNKQTELESDLSQCKSDIDVLKSRIEGNNDNIKRINLEISELNVKFDEFEKSVSAEESVLSGLRNKKASLMAEITDVESKLTVFDKNTAEDNKLIDEINSEIISKLSLVSDLKAQISNCNALITTYKERSELLKNELEDKAKDYEKLQKNVENLQKNCEELTQNQGEISKELEKETDILNKNIADFSNAQLTLTQKQQELQQAISRQKLLKDLENSFDNYSKSVKSVMKEYQNGTLSNLDLYGTVASLISVENQYSTAVEVALGGAAQNIVTETEDDAKSAIDFLKKTKQGRATFLPISAAKSANFDDSGVKNCQGYIAIASQLVSCDSKYKNVISGLLGRIVVVDNVDNAVKIAKKYSYKFRIVTLSGELLAPGGSMTGGSRNNSNGLFARANEIVQLEETINVLSNKIKNCEENCEKFEKNVKNSKENVNKLQEKLAEINSEIIRLNSDIDHSSAFATSVFEGKTAMETEVSELVNNISVFNVKIAESNHNIDIVTNEIKVLEDTLTERKNLLGNNSAERENIVNVINSKRIELNSVDKDIESAIDRINTIVARKQEITLNIDQKNNNIDELKETNDSWNDDIEFKSEQIQSITEEIAKVKQDIENSENSRKDAQSSIKTQQEENKVLREEQFKLQQEYSRVENKKAKSEVELENIINNLWDDYELTTSSAEQLREEIPANATKEISKLKTEIKDLGNINIDAIEEYKQVGERYDFLTSQRDDLVEAKNNLEQVISDMMVIMKEQFTSKFSVINKHFGDTFTQLFGGGKAELVLTEPTDVLNSGVEINVQPPGKAVKSILQLSGGEQAFVSIALLFAILKVRPSPFCVLDEIEAALDDVNVYRFADYLKKFSKNSQFIVVTHRRGTMEAANILYGVTMQEQGVSRLLSLNIDDVVDMNVV